MKFGVLVRGGEFISVNPICKTVGYKVWEGCLHKVELLVAACGGVNYSGLTLAPFL